MEAPFCPLFQIPWIWLPFCLLNCLRCLKTLVGLSIEWALLPSLEKVHTNLYSPLYWLTPISCILIGSQVWYMRPWLIMTNHHPIGRGKTLGGGLPRYERRVPLLSWLTGLTSPKKNSPLYWQWDPILRTFAFPRTCLSNRQLAHVHHSLQNLFSQFHSL